MACPSHVVLLLRTLNTNDLPPFTFIYYHSIIIHHTVFGVTAGTFDSRDVEPSSASFAFDMNPQDQDVFPSEGMEMMDSESEDELANNNMIVGRSTVLVEDETRAITVGMCACGAAVNDVFARQY
eukprot:scaffold20417_cov156-Skeletonema_marinoi.AAC.5